MTNRQCASYSVCCVYLIVWTPSFQTQMRASSAEKSVVHLTAEDSDKDSAAQPEYGAPSSPEQISPKKGTTKYTGEAVFDEDEDGSPTHHQQPRQPHATPAPPYRRNVQPAGGAGPTGPSQEYVTTAPARNELKDKLATLTALHDEGYIHTEVYKARQAALLEASGH